MSDMEALKHTIEAYAHLDVAKRAADSEEVEEPIRQLLKWGVDKRCEVVNQVGENLADGIEFADQRIEADCEG